jgi:hypothetical protein
MAFNLVSTHRFDPLWGVAVRETIAIYKLYAAYCMEIAGNSTDPARKVSMLSKAQAWRNLADRAERGGERHVARPQQQPQPDDKKE